MKCYEFITDAKSGKVIKLALFSDIHYDSPDCDRETLRKHLNFCLKDGRYILFGGDLFDAILLKDMKRAVPHLIENTDAQLNKKIDNMYEFLKPYRENILFMGRGNHCLIEDTDVLTADGFKPIKEITESDFVANYDVERDTIVYDNPQQIHHIDYDGDMYMCESQVLNFGVSPDHRMFGINERGKPYYRLAKDFNRGSLYTAKVAVESKSIGVSLSDDELRLLGWLLTDAHIPNTGGAIIYQSKEKFVDDIRRLLDRMHIEYKETVRHRKIKSICGKVLKTVKPQHEFRLHINFVRELQELAKSGNWFGVIKNANQRQFQVFFNTIIDADGNRPKTAKSCCAIHGKKEILEKFQILCFLHGIRASLSISTRGHYVLNCVKTTTAQIRKWGDTVVKIKNPFDKIYCLTMPQSNFVCRRKGRIMITGNCESIIKYNGLDVLQMLATMLNMGQEHKILVGNYANFLRFTAKDPTGKVCFYDIYQHHGAGGSAPATKGMLDFQSIAKGVNVDLIWLAHKHNSLVDYSTPIMSVNTQGDVVLKNRQCIMTPSYQKGRTIDYNVNFAERMYGHTALSGFGELNLRIERAGKEIGNDGHKRFALIPDVKITTIPAITIGRVQTAVLKQKQR